MDDQLKMSLVKNTKGPDINKIRKVFRAETMKKDDQVKRLRAQINSQKKRVQMLEEHIQGEQRDSNKIMRDLVSSQYQNGEKVSKEEYLAEREKLNDQIKTLKEQIAKLRKAEAQARIEKMDPQGPKRDMQDVLNEYHEQILQRDEEKQQLSNKYAALKRGTVKKEEYDKLNNAIEEQLQRYP